MRFFVYGLALAAVLPFTACNKSIEAEREDVREAQEEAHEDVKAEVRDAQDAAIEGQRDVLEEKRELEDAKAENRTP